MEARWCSDLGEGGLRLTLRCVTFFFLGTLQNHIFGTLNASGESNWLLCFIELKIYLSPTKEMIKKTESQCEIIS